MRATDRPGTRTWLLLPATTALKNSLSSLDTAIKSAKGQPPLTAAAAVVAAVTQVKTSASNLQSAVKGKCQ